MFNNAIVDFLLRHTPRNRWDLLSSLCTVFSRSTIGSPIQFSLNEYSIVEFPANNLPEPLYNKFLQFCYPSTLANREEQIENDRKYYWKNASTFIVLNAARDILGCVQILFRNESLLLPVEYADVTDVHKRKSHLDIAPFQSNNTGVVTEIYRCRRSFALNKAQTFTVLMMLFKAVWIKIHQTDSSCSLISFDPDHPELRNLYTRKLDFTDPHITLTYGRNPKEWSLLVKDWEEHRKHYISKGKFHFYMQTWSNMNVRKNCSKLKERYHQATNTNSILFTQTVSANKTIAAQHQNVRKIALRGIPEEDQTR